MENVELSILFGQTLGDSLIVEFILLLLCVAFFEGMKECHEESTFKLVVIRTCRRLF